MSVLGLVNSDRIDADPGGARCITLACGYEISVPATKTFLNQVAAFLYLALRMGKHPAAPLVETLPGLISTRWKLPAPQVQALEPLLAGRDDLYCLGYGMTYPIALEGALKLKEITYAHCEGCYPPNSNMSPCPRWTKVIRAVRGRTAGCAADRQRINEVTCRGGCAIVVGPDDNRLRMNANHLITLPAVDPETAPCSQCCASIALLPSQSGARLRPRLPA